MRITEKTTLVWLLTLVLITCALYSGVSAEDAAARIGDVEYATLQAAADAVPNDGTETTITILKDYTDGGVGLFNNKKGYPESTNKNIIFDFDGHTVTIGVPLVGSTGTETQSFHLEKGNTVTLKNGTLQSNESLMLIQNYCNLTLDNMKVDCSTSSTAYTVSCNNGTVLFTNGTEINASGGGYAFDVCVTKYYPAGVQITIDDAVINGTVQYDVWGGIPEPNNASLTITGGEFNTGAFDIEDALQNAVPEMTFITGGTFDSDPGGLVEDGYMSVGEDGSFVVTKMVINTANEDLTYTGNEQELVSLSTEAEGTFLYSTDGENYSPEVPTGSDAGDYTVYYQLVTDDGTVADSGSFDVTIGPKSLTDRSIIASIDPEIVDYDGLEHTPAVTVFDSEAGKNLTEGVDYETDLEPQSMIGKYTVTVTAVGNEASGENDGTDDTNTDDDNGGNGMGGTAKAAAGLNYTGSLTLSWEIVESSNRIDMFEIGQNLYRFPEFCRDCKLPNTGFSSHRETRLSVQPVGLVYKDLNMRIQIPSMNLDADLVGIPLVENNFPVEWLGENVGVLSGSSLPGEGYSMVAAHNTLNNTEYGPFALLSTLRMDDLVFVYSADGEMIRFKVYANELMHPDDFESIRAIAEQEEGTLVMVTCENEVSGGEYLNRRVIFAKPM